MESLVAILLTFAPSLASVAGIITIALTCIYKVYKALKTFKSDSTATLIESQKLQAYIKELIEREKIKTDLIAKVEGYSDIKYQENQK